MKNKQIVSIGVLLVVVAGVSAGLGTLVSLRSFDDYAQTLRDSVVFRHVTEVKAPVVPGTIQESVDAVLKQTDGTFMEVVDVGAAVHRKGVVRSASVGLAMALTTDGWVMMPGDLHEEYSKTLRVVYDGELHEVTGWVDDPVTGFVFGRTDIDDARVDTFGSPLLVEAGDLAFVLYGDQVIPRTIASSEWYEDEGSLMSSDVMDRRFLLDQAVDLPEGAVVTDASGALIGVVSGSREVIPLHHFTSALESVLGGGDIVRGGIGIEYRDLSRVIIDDEDDDLTSGYLVVLARPDGAADVAGVLGGDVILRVNGVSFEDRPLAEFVVTAMPGEELVLSVLREETEMEISVIIDEL